MNAMSEHSRHTIAYTSHVISENGYLTDVQCRQAINAAMRDQLTMWQYLKVKPTPEMINDFPEILKAVMLETNQKGLSGEEAVDHLCYQLADIYGTIIKRALGIA